MVIVWPNGAPIRKHKGSKTRISPQKRKICHAELLAILCGVSKKSIMKYFSNAQLELSNPRAVRKRVEARLEKYGNLTGLDNKATIPPKPNKQGIVKTKENFM